MSNITNRMLTVCGLLAVALLGLGCTGSPVDSGPPPAAARGLPMPSGPARPPDPAGVYAAILEGDLSIPRSGGTATLRIVRAETVTPRPQHVPDPDRPEAFWERFSPRIEGARPSCLADFVSAVEETALLPALNLGSGLALEVWPEQRWSRFLRAETEHVDEREAEFHREHPHAAGILGVSAIGFSEDGRQALVYVTRWQGFLSGSGWFLLLTFDDASGWTEVSRCQVWRS